MKLLIVTPLYPPSIGGPATYTKLLESELPKHNIEVEIYSFDSVRKYPKFIRHIIFTLGILFRVPKSKIIYVLDPVSVGVPSTIIAILTRKKLFLKVVGDYAWEQGVQRFGINILLDDFIKTKPKNIILKIIWWCQRWVAKNAYKIIVPSKYLAKIVESYGVDKNKIKIIYNSVHLPKNVYKKDESRKKLQLKGNIFVSSGRLVPWKGFACLIDAFIQANIINSYLYIIGSGPQKKEILNKIKEHNAENKIKLIEQLPQDELFEYIISADCFILNTGYEGLSHQLLEVMSLEIPIITTNVGGNPELIENNISGILVDYNDVISLSKAMVRSIEQPNPGFLIKAKQKAEEFQKLSAVKGLVKEII